MPAKDHLLEDNALRCSGLQLHTGYTDGLQAGYALRLSDERMSEADPELMSMA